MSFPCVAFDREQSFGGIFFLIKKHCLGIRFTCVNIEMVIFFQLENRSLKEAELGTMYTSTFPLLGSCSIIGCTHTVLQTQGLPFMSDTSRS